MAHGITATVSARATSKFFISIILVSMIVLQNT